ncbi:hypothetical protein KIW84_021400 [Lathyrus oleraceus]|uniref:Uncharacterized protein n=1 Tax=Pisum sativum TaxID=3888 RepID=A0A9D4Y8Y4_PEA|nr:hypothetical protein KIW84_021400 [Pisum sativum]
MNLQYRFHIRSKPRGSNSSDDENVKSLGPVTSLLKGQDLPVKSDDDKEVQSRNDPFLTLGRMRNSYRYAGCVSLLIEKLPSFTYVPFISRMKELFSL